MSQTTPSQTEYRLMMITKAFIENIDFIEPSGIDNYLSISPEYSLKVKLREKKYQVSIRMADD